MGNTVDIDAVTGPDRRVHLKLAEVNEICFNFGKSVINVTRADGNMSNYDMEKTATVNFTRKGDDLEVKIGKGEQDDQPSPKAGTETGGPDLPKLPSTGGKIRPEGRW